MKSKIYTLFGIAILFGISLVSATTYQDPFDMVYLLVENTFGGILITIVGMIAFFWVLGMMSRMHPLTIIYFNILFAATMTIGYLGGVGAFLAGIFCMWYFISAIVNLINSGRT